ncbi:MAG TPA: hypothetical protein VJ046_00030 [Candidatus Paceibacterota bacterium]|nr:hypothetical protein [Candidatus Paceibacterota bacterium]
MSDSITCTLTEDKDGFLLLSPILGSKAIFRAYKFGKIKRLSHKGNQHRGSEIEGEGGPRIRGKLYDISKFKK